MCIGPKVACRSVVALAFLLIISAVVVVTIVQDEMRTGGMHVKWTFQDTDIGGRYNNYRIAIIDENGTIIANEYMSQ